MRNLTRSLIWLLLLFALFTPVRSSASWPWNKPADPTVNDANWKPKYVKPKTFGSRLEAAFTDMLGDCHVQRFQTDNPNRTSVPPILQTKFNSEMDLAMVSVQNSVGTTFRFIYPSRQYTQPVTYIQKSLLKAEYLPSAILEPTPEPNGGDPGVIYNQTCGAVLSAALEAKLTIPNISIQTALSGSSSSNASLAIVRGVFLSPLYAWLHGPLEDLIPARLAEWDWYQRNQDRAAGPNYYVSGFKGAVIYNVFGRGWEDHYSIKASGGHNWVVASLSANAGGSQDDVYKLRSTNYDTLIEGQSDSPNALSVYMDELEPPRAIATAMKTLQLQLVDAPPVIRAGQTYSFGVYLPGVPPAYCVGSWTLRSAAAGVAAQGGGAGVDNGRCIFRVQYDVPKIVGNIPATVPFEINSAQTVQGEPLVLTGELKTTERTTNQPLVYVSDQRVRKPQVVSASDGTGARYEWTIPLFVIDKDNPVDAARSVDVQKAVLHCGAEASDIVLDASAIRNGFITLTARRQAGPKDDAQNPDDCQVTAIVIVPVGGQMPTVQSRDISAGVLVPRTSKTIVAPSVTTTVTPSSVVTPDFSISLPAGPISMTVGSSSANISLNTAVSGGFNSDITLSAAPPAGLAITFNPAVVNSPGAGVTIMTVTKGSAATGTYPITVTATGGGTTHTATLTVAIP